MIPPKNKDIGLFWERHNLLKSCLFLHILPQIPHCDRVMFFPSAAGLDQIDESADCPGRSEVNWSLATG